MTEWPDEWQVLFDPTGPLNPGDPVYDAAVEMVEAMWPGWHFAYEPDAVVWRKRGDRGYEFGVKALCRKGREKREWDNQPGGFQWDEGDELLPYFLTGVFG